MVKYILISSSILLFTKFLILLRIVHHGQAANANVSSGIRKHLNNGNKGSRQTSEIFEKKNKANHLFPESPRRHFVKFRQHSCRGRGCSMSYSYSMSYRVSAGRHQKRTKRHFVKYPPESSYSMSFHYGKPKSEMKQKLDPNKIPMFVEDLTIPFVLYDSTIDSQVEVAMRQISQQVLPSGFPKTKLWAYGNPKDAATFYHPAGTIENVEMHTMEVKWTNELVVDPEKCRIHPNSDACNYLIHVIQDKNGVPLVDQTLHWAAPNQQCAEGKPRTDCRGKTTEAYDGPIPITTHVHGAHVDSRSDGYPESWFLPSSNNIPPGYATQGTYYSTSGEYVKRSANKRPKGYAVYHYDNSEISSTLFYHDHALGMTRLNVYAAGAGFWLIRRANHREDFLVDSQTFPGPAPAYGQDPNSDPDVRKTIREIPLAIQQMSFYDDGSLFFPANRVYHAMPECSTGEIFAETNGMPDIPFIPKGKSDISPIWNPEAFFDTWVVNGKTWPKLKVAPERYRFRLLNIADSAFINLFLKTADGKHELPIYVIGSEQGLIPHVVGITSGNYTIYSRDKNGEIITKTIQYRNSTEALLMGPGYRFDVIVDFSNLVDGTEIIMHNSAPDEPFKGFGTPEFKPANARTTGKIMKFIVNDNLKNPQGDKSTLPRELISNAPELKETVHSNVRDVVLLEKESDVCVDEQDDCDASQSKCNGSNSFGPTMAMLGYGRKETTKPSMWSDPICMNIKNGTTEIVHLWNWTEDAHPIHLHLISFLILGRYEISEFDKYYDGSNPTTTGVQKLTELLPYEYLKDTATSYPKTVTQLLVTFDRPGLYVWHCHILSHEDNEMMLPFCVGKPGVDCPIDLFSGEQNTCPKQAKI